MVDIVDKATRSRMMAGIGGRNTKPELLVRKSLHSRGLRYALGGAHLPGRPDIVLSKWKVAVFVHGCFWHWHGCHLSKMPTSNTAFWQTKLEGNRTRDLAAELALLSAGWRVAIIWECATRSAPQLRAEDLMSSLYDWITTSSSISHLEISQFGILQNDI